MTKKKTVGEVFKENPKLMGEMVELIREGKKVRDTMTSWCKRFRKKDGIEMRLFVDLMIANQGDKKEVRRRLDELDGFISQELERAREEGWQSGYKQTKEDYLDSVRQTRGEMGKALRMKKRGIKNKLMKKRTLYEKVGEILSTLLMKIGMWCFTRMCEWVDIYAPNDEVVGITFSSSKEYIDYVNKYEKEKTD